MNTPIVFVVGGESYCRDAVQSAESYKRNNPNIKCIIATDYNGGVSSIFDGKIQLTNRKYPQNMWYLDSCRYYNEAFNVLKDEYNALCFVDSDTYCDGPLDDMFPLTDRFDICVSHGVTRQTTNTVSVIPDSFPEFEIGVMLVSTNERVKNLFTDWLELFSKHSNIYKDNDQGPLREALWLNKYINMYVLAEEFHCRYGFGSCVVSKVRIFHSRSTADAMTNAQVAKEINSTGGRRLIHPEGDHMAWWRPIKGEERYKE